MPEAPSYPRQAPALLGFDEAIMEYCLEKLGTPKKVTQLPETNLLANTCVKANYNILRLMHGWNLCANLQWMVCAVHGELPGQRGDSTVLFAAAPYTLGRIEDLARRTKVSYWVSDVYYLEVCLFNHICRNRHELFSLARGKAFRCNVDLDALDDLAHLLRASQ